MRVLCSASLSLVLLVSSASFAQAPAPAVTAAAPPPAIKIDPNSPEQAGRTALNNYLNAIAAKDEEARRTEIAKITTRDQAVVRQQEVRHKLLQLTGGSFKRTPLNAKVLGSTQMEGFRIEKILFESQPNFFVTALLYLPDAPQSSGAPSLAASSPRVGQQKLPAIVVSPGHGSSGKVTDFAISRIFALNGFAVLSYDPIGQGERLEYPDPAHPDKTLATASTGEHAEAALQPTLIGDAIARYFVWDSMSAVDYLLTRPEIDPDRIGAFGCSGGGVMTAMFGAADKRVKTIATACYLTTMDTLLPSIGPQDAEQSIPGFIASGLDFADWVEQAAPRPYAMVGTVSDMFPWAGFLATATEARHFYSLFDPKAEGTPTGKPLPPTPTGPTLNPDTSNDIPPDSPLQVIAGIGRHGNLRPLYPEIVRFFLANLAHSTADPIVPPQPAGANPFAPPDVPAGTLQVTPTGQVATSYPGCETIHTLNLKRAAQIIPVPVKPQTLLQVQTDIREVTNAEAVPNGFTRTRTAGGDDPYNHTARSFTEVGLSPSLTNDPDGTSEIFATHVSLHERDGFDLPAVMVGHESKGASPKGMLLIVPDLGMTTPNGPPSPDLLAQMLRLAHQGYNVLAVAPRPSPPGEEETKSPILGPFYMTEIRAELVGKTLLGMRVDDVLAATDYLSYEVSIHPIGVDPDNITAVAGGHMGLVLMHAAALDPRLKHIIVDHVLESYHSLLEAPMPLDAPQDILPGVLLKYDIPDLVRVLGPRVTATDWLSPSPK